MKSTEELIDETRLYAATFYDSSVTSTPQLLLELAELLEQLSKERAEMVAALKEVRQQYHNSGYTLRQTAHEISVDPVTLSKWTADDTTTEPDFVSLDTTQ